MTYKRFEDLPVWQQACRLHETITDSLETAPPVLRPSFRDQLERAALSVSNNMAEGFEHGTTNELLRFVYIARGSAGEVRLERRRWRAPRHLEIAHLKSIAVACSPRLRAWADSLQNTDIRGQRHSNRRARDDRDQEQRAFEVKKTIGIDPGRSSLAQECPGKGYPLKSPLKCEM